MDRLLRYGAGTHAAYSLSGCGSGDRGFSVNRIYLARLIGGTAAPAFTGVVASPVSAFAPLVWFSFLPAPSLLHCSDHSNSVALGVGHDPELSDQTI